ncbi:peptidylprolyl isomerase [Porticoccus sp.]|jgi:cyclophilin family peptidyl-prolyl cis-trans isomerase|nr:peptidylprolyl isomerase [Porticoccus sp.]MDC1093359.1 peptidylprolyl isomerase [Porticoccus sp.]
MYKRLLFTLFFMVFSQLSVSYEHSHISTNESIKKITKNSKVLLTTNMGEILLELYPNKAPLTVDNFLAYVEKKYYDGLIFHRVIPGFMIQAGGFNEDISRMTPFGGNIPNESHNGLKNKKYTIAMARTSDPDSARAQFFINVVDNSSLDATSGKAGYAVFGRVIRGMNVAEKISRLPTQRAAGMRDVPTATIKIIKAIIIEDK